MAEKKKAKFVRGQVVRVGGSYHKLLSTKPDRDGRVHIRRLDGSARGAASPNIPRDRAHVPDHNLPRGGDDEGQEAEVQGRSEGSVQAFAAGDSCASCLCKGFVAAREVAAPAPLPEITMSTRDGSNPSDRDIDTLVGRIFSITINWHEQQKEWDATKVKALILAWHEYQNKSSRVEQVAPLPHAEKYARCIALLFWPTSTTLKEQQERLPGLIERVVGYMNEWASAAPSPTLPLTYELGSLMTKRGRCVQCGSNGHDACSGGTAAEGERPRDSVQEKRDAEARMIIEQAQADRGSVQTALPEDAEVIRRDEAEEAAEHWLDRRHIENVETSIQINGLVSERVQLSDVLAAYLLTQPAPTPLSAEELASLRKAQELVAIAVRNIMAQDGVDAYEYIHAMRRMKHYAEELQKAVDALPGVAVVRK